MNHPTPTGAAELPEALRMAADLSSIFISEELHATKARRIAAELRRLHQSEREGWRYADELKQDLDRLRAQVEALSAAQAGVPADAAKTILEKVDTIIACVNEAHHAKSVGWRRGYFAGADSAYEELKAMLAEDPQPIPSPAPACTRSHPHEAMSWRCQVLSVVAELRSMEARGQEATGHELGAFADRLDAAVLSAPAHPGQEGEPVAEMVPCHTPSGKRVAVISRFQHLPIGTKLYTHPQPAAQDAERLDWLEADAGKCVFHVVGTWYTRPSYGLPYRKRANLREAIDAAIASQQGDRHEL